MPAKVSKNADGTYRVKTPNATHAKGTTLEKAKKQQRLLNAIEHGWEPGNTKHERIAKKHKMY